MELEESDSKSELEVLGGIVVCWRAETVEFSCSYFTRSHPVLGLNC